MWLLLSLFLYAGQTWGMPISLMPGDVPGKAPILAGGNARSPHGNAEIRRVRPTVAEKKKGVTRILLLGGGGLSGFDLEPGETLAAQLQKSVRDLKKNVEIVGTPLPEDLALGSLNRLPFLLESIKPDYVFYFIPGASVLIQYAALDSRVQRDAQGKALASDFFTEDSALFKAYRWVFRMESPQDQFFLRYLNLQVSQISLGRRLTQSENKREDLIRPAAEAIKRAEAYCAEHGIKFRALWSGLPIYASTWTNRFPNQAAYYPLRWSEYLKTRVTANAEEVVDTMQDLKVPLVLSAPSGKVIRGINFANRASPEELRSSQSVQKIAQALAPAVAEAIR